MYICFQPYQKNKPKCWNKAIAILLYGKNEQRENARNNLRIKSSPVGNHRAAFLKCCHPERSRGIFALPELQSRHAMRRSFDYGFAFAQDDRGVYVLNKVSMVSKR